MTLMHTAFTFHYPDDFDDRAVLEMTDKSYLAGAAVELPGRGRFAVSFFTPTRLRQELESVVGHGGSVLAEPGLVVIPDVTPEAILRAIPELIADGFFDYLRPLPAVARIVANGVPA